MPHERNLTDGPLTGKPLIVNSLPMAALTAHESPMAGAVFLASAETVPRAT
jgi:hypothetical protein